MQPFNSNVITVCYHIGKSQWRIQDFPKGGRGPVRGRGPPTRVLFSENVCENKRIGSRRGACTGHALPQIRQ